ncbi:cytolytic toxin-beta-like [Daphnia pulex]|uniref:cytolytic toxin-beta-like n=1 Tax=Daphnia pulex TaxID=6669 RepID=UPI001EE0E1D9|nr:cytolytic toxin-beta-like [Daphnia pulex]
MFNKLDTNKMIALGRNFSIGTLYNHIEDVIVPNMRLWDPSDVSCLATVKTERKETVKVHSIVAEQMSEEEDDIDDDESGTTLLSDLGMDNHSAMSLMAGLLHPSLAGAWQYLIDRSDSTMGLFDLGSEVAIHCCSSSRKVSVDPTSLEIICRPERLIKSQATHVVVAVTYGLKAFCIFSPQLGPHPKSSRDEDDYAHYFANGLLNGRNQLELDEEDEDGRLIPLNLQCLLYSDLIGVKSGQSWTLKDVGEQYQACRKVMDHLASTAIPLRVWLYPLGKLMQTEANNIHKIQSSICNLKQ